MTLDAAPIAAADTHRRVPVDLGVRSYDILIGPGLMVQLPALLAERFAGRSCILIGDRSVAAAPGAALEAAGLLRGPPILLPAGEGTKSLASFADVMERVLAQRPDRRTLVLALGGGVIGDLAGFAAAAALRGIDFMQIPTTLLAQIDSSVGGKTGINAKAGKNLIGAFHQPRLVVADTDSLATLPVRELRAGYAEMVKYGLLGDAGFFRWLEANGPAVLALQPEALAEAIAHCCAMKAGIVARDETETGERALLNLGHTFGHGLEALHGYDGRLLHGEGVALGCVLALRLSVQLGFAPVAALEAATAHLDAAGLPVRLADLPLGKPDPETLIAAMAGDKKAEGGRLVFILMRDIGEAFIARDVPVEAVRTMLDDAA